MPTGAAGLPLAGVEAIIEGLQKFESDTRRLNNSLESIHPRTTMLQRGFETLTDGIVGFGKSILEWGVDTLASFGESIIHIAEYALGQLLADAIEFVIGKIKDLISATIEAGAEFQTLQIRLNGMNLQDAIDSGLDYEQGMEKAIQVTQEQLDWLQTLGAATPFDPAQIANIYTLARSYGFADEEARRLTRNVTEYTAGMGLSDEVLERVIQNMGQMVQRGKITSTEIRDLARGAYLPLANVLDRVAKKMGITRAELAKKISEPGGGVPAQEFIDAFNEMIEQEPRFIGAAGRLGRALVPATKNVKELFTSLGGRNIVTPVFDVLGEKIASITDQFVRFNEQGDLIVTEKWDKAVAAATRIGETISGIVTDLLGLTPSSESIADGLIKALGGIADWLDEHREDIIGFFQRLGTIIQEKVVPWLIDTGETIRDDVIPWIRDYLIPFLGKIATWVIENSPAIKLFFQELGETIRDDVIPWIRDELIPFFERIGKWVEDNGPLIKEFFKTLGEIAGTVFKDVLEWLGKKVEGDSVLDSITTFMEFVVENKDKIAEWVGILAKAVIVWQVLSTVWNIAMGILIPLIGFVLTLVVVFQTLSLVAATLGAVISGPVLAAIAGIIIAFTLAVIAGRLLGEGIVKALLWIRDNISWIDWKALGASIVWGLINGLNSVLPGLGNILITAMATIYNRVKEFLGIHSPSTLFMGIGQSLMEGVANGIQNGVSVVEGAIAHISGVIAEKINHAISVAQEKMNHLSSILGGGGIDFSGLGIGVSTAWAYGISQGISVGEKAGRKMAEQTTNSAKKKLRARSPSLVFEELGMFTVQGFAQGIEKATGLAVGAMQNAMSAAMVPAISSLAGAGGSSVTNNHTANLTINTSAPVEPIVQDFNMLSSLMGA